jgi:hypothetical protein
VSRPDSDVRLWAKLKCPVLPLVLTVCVPWFQYNAALKGTCHDAREVGLENCDELVYELADSSSAKVLRLTLGIAYLLGTFVNFGVAPRLVKRAQFSESEGNFSADKNALQPLTGAHFEAVRPRLATP